MRKSYPFTDSSLSTKLSFPQRVIFEWHNVQLQCSLLFKFALRSTLHSCCVAHFAWTKCRLRQLNPSQKVGPGKEARDPWYAFFEIHDHIPPNAICPWLGVRHCMQHCHTFTCHGPANGHNSLSLLCSYWNTNACRACRALFFFIIPCNESASGVLLARVTSFAGGYKSSAQNLVLCLRLDQRSVDWHPGHAFHVQQRLFQRERERG